jgi:lysyl-tRNA synthetase class 2
MNAHLSPEEIVRREALQKLRQLGIDPFPANEFVTTSTAHEAKAGYEEGKEVTLAGRIMNQRVMGKATFGDLQDSSGKIQL